MSFTQILGIVIKVVISIIIVQLIFGGVVFIISMIANRNRI